MKNLKEIKKAIMENIKTLHIEVNNKENTLKIHTQDEVGFLNGGIPLSVFYRGMEEVESFYEYIYEIQGLKFYMTEYSCNARGLKYITLKQI